MNLNDNRYFQKLVNFILKITHIKDLHFNYLYYFCKQFITLTRSSIL